jgi:hypothetical protein
MWLAYYLSKKINVNELDAKHALTLPKLHDVTQTRLGTSCLRVLMVGISMGKIMFLGFIGWGKSFRVYYSEVKGQGFLGCLWFNTVGLNCKKAWKSEQTGCKNYRKCLFEGIGLGWKDYLLAKDY